MVWEFVFMMVILKIPIVYLGLVVYWAIKAEPNPPEPAVLPVAAPGPDSPGPRHAQRRRRPRPGPHGKPTRRYARSSRSALPTA